MSVKTIVGNWQRATEPQLFTADDLINAYFSGQRDFATNQEKVLAQQLDVNLERIKKIGESIFHSINTMGIPCSRVYLKIDDISSFKLLFLINEKKFQIELLKGVYNLLMNLETEECSDTFQFMTSLVPEKTSLNRKTIIADGYYLNYGQQRLPSTGKTQRASLRIPT